MNCPYCQAFPNSDRPGFFACGSGKTESMSFRTKGCQSRELAYLKGLLGKARQIITGYSGWHKNGGKVLIANIEEVLNRID